MEELGILKKRNLRDLWPNEAHDFTPWLADNVSALGEALGMELELKGQEVSVGDFSLDLLAKDLGSEGLNSEGKVVIENQLTPTDHDHLGKLLTYASGRGASTVIWVAESIRDEHRQALEWLNQKTDSDTQFFGVVVEVLQIDNSKPVYNFRPIVFPNEWQKVKLRQVAGQFSGKEKAYKEFFQALIDDLRENHRFTSARTAWPKNWTAFGSRVSGINFGAVFARDGQVCVRVYFNKPDMAKNKALFDALEKQKESIEKELGDRLEWERRDDKKASQIAIYRDGAIESADDELKEWMVDNLLAFKKVFAPRIKELTSQ